MGIRRAPYITAEQENYRLVPFYDSPGVRGLTPKRDPVEPVPIGTYVVKVFRVTGYDPDCDGSLMARLENVGADGEATGWEVAHLGLYPETTWIVDEPGELDRLSQP